MSFYIPDVSPTDIWLFQCWILLCNGGKNRKDILEEETFSPNVIPFIILSAVCSYQLPNIEWQLIISRLYPDLKRLFFSLSLSWLVESFRGKDFTLVHYEKLGWMFPANTYIHTLQIIISCHFCTERLGKNLQQNNKATLLEFIQWDCNNKNCFSVDTRKDICMLLKLSVWISFFKMGFSIMQIICWFLWSEACWGEGVASSASLKSWM